MAAETTAELAQYQSDHDLLVRIDERMSGMHEKVEKLTDDHETRIRALERHHQQYFSRQSIGGSGIATVAATAIVAVLHILKLL